MADHPVEDEGAFAISSEFGTREATRAAIDRTTYVVQLRSYLAHSNVAIGPGELMSLHWSIFGEAFPDLAGTQRKVEIDIHGDRCSPPEMIGEHLAEFTFSLNADLREIEAATEDETIFNRQLELVTLSHARLLHIHPFVDGNGRTARVLLNLLLRRFQLRPIELKKQDGYISDLRRAIAGEPGRLRVLIEDMVDHENERLLRIYEQQSHRRRRRYPR